METTHVKDMGLGLRVWGSGHMCIYDRTPTAPEDEVFGRAWRQARELEQRANVCRREVFEPFLGRLRGALHAAP